MGGVGRPKTSNAVKIMRATNQACRMNPVGVELSKVEVIPKTKLKGIAKKIYLIAATELVAKKVLEPVGLDLFVAYCQEMALYYDMCIDLKEEKYVIEMMTKQGKRKMVNPKRKVAQEALKNAQSLAGEFGLTPATRHKINAVITGGDERDDFSDFEEV